MIAALCAVLTASGAFIGTWAAGRACGRLRARQAARRARIAAIEESYERDRR